MQQGFKLSSTRYVLLVALTIAILCLAGCGKKTVKPVSVCESNPTSQSCLCTTDPASEACLCATDANSEACVCYGSEVRGEVEIVDCFCLRNPGHSICPQPDLAKPACPTRDLDTLIDSILENVDSGRWAEAEELSQCAVTAHPDDLRAANIKNQLDLGGNYFKETKSTAYTVQNGDSLARIAKRCLPSKNTDDFIALARYNSISVPRDLKRDTKIILPGSKPCVDVGELVKDGKAALESGDFKQAYLLFKRAYEISPTSQHKALLDESTELYVESLHSEAQSESEQGNCSKAREIWAAILKLSPSDEQAKYYLKHVTC